MFGLLNETTLSVFLLTDLLPPPATRGGGGGGVGGRFRGGGGCCGGGTLPCTGCWCILGLLNGSLGALFGLLKKSSASAVLSTDPTVICATLWV